jgi:hypothetical protein
MAVGLGMLPATIVSENPGGSVAACETWYVAVIRRQVAASALARAK